MDVSLVADTVTVFTKVGLGFASSLLHRHNYISNNVLSLSDCSADQSASSTGVIHAPAVIFLVDALAPPPVKPNSRRTVSRTLTRKKRRTKRKLFGGDDSGNGEDGGFFGDNDGDGPFSGGGNYWGGGNGWNFGGFGGQNWDESSSSSSGFALDFIYEVIAWIALSNCVHFAFKKLLRTVADGIGDAERGKGPMRLTSIY
ncbi:hypothetical protein HS088_TW01G00086 [Tripterygium wilfordii]|uniref:Uncharacterized protein n=1 Tax=Tripterygium wilfordii TaxID=458696 RepID=A0A7J7E0W6_TRIWF|nr:uncharacterized protein LOC120002133 [Tripterygium wilfordii]KAF5752179.1 hypothetical protein HS088_TW01G00086 [Tripterygium wilfordii]